MDVLTDVLETVRVVAACYGRLEATAPWGIRVKPGDDAKFHVVLEGHARLIVDGVEDPIELSAGDIVALPHGHAHSLVDDAEIAAQALEELLVCRPRGDNSVLRVGGGGQSATIVSGRFRFEDRKNNPLLSVLPPVITLKGEMGKSVRWLEPTLKFIACEAQSGRPGSQTVIARLADVLFIQIVRGHLATLPANGSGWLGALSDTQIGAALGFIHQSPEQDWTVQSLAAKVAMSRSAFASRFMRLVGEPPLSYVTRWRMQKAASMLRDGKRTLAEVAAQVGYDSEAAFSKAFKRAVGSAPGAYRRALKPGLEVAA
ncbi:MAG TPA: AraC family transcriptional regulator [Polyangiaceae bacterium]|jgi:AraC-like DNA-binding protein